MTATRSESKSAGPDVARLRTVGGLGSHEAEAGTSLLVPGSPGGGKAPEAARLPVVQVAAHERDGGRTVAGVRPG
ncbi:hypothetical protein ACIBF1_07945 [Spirillospora sp. NPDC050679]